MRSAYVVAVLLLVSVVAFTEASRRNRPSESTYNCTGGAETGHCRAAFRRWYYDTTDGQCKEFTWGGCGGNGNRFNTQSQCERLCGSPTQDVAPARRDRPVRCSPATCRKYCQFGFRRDENNCTICACQSAPRECPQIECPDTSCPNGYEVDADGCSLCSCRPSVQHHVVVRSVTCPPVCYMYCSHGNKKDENGCDICECNSAPAQNRTRDGPQRGSSGGGHYFHDRHGGRGQQNKSSSERTDRPHQGGRHGDRHGDRHGGRHGDRHGDRHHGGRRTTANPGDSAVQLPADGTTVSCPHRSCGGLRCSNGYSTDSFGCRICRCSSSNSPFMTTRGHWPSRRTARPSITATPSSCDNRPMCAMYCQNGFKQGSDGCDICECN